MERTPLAQRIRAFRKLKGFTQQELAQELGVSIALLGAIERGTRKPESSIIKQISRTLGIEQQELEAVSAR
jgi:transcriptional regulator with XRE-family HTH domain